MQEEILGQSNLTGYINYNDLNRIENNTRVTADIMLSKGIVHSYITLNSKYNWRENEIPTKTDLNRIINNVLILQNLSVPGLPLHKIGLNAQWEYSFVNFLEENIDMMYKQEPRDENKYHLEVINGSGTGDYEDNTVVRIEAFAPETNKTFSHWTGEPYALAQIGNVKAISTTFTINHQDAIISPKYVSIIPHKFNVVNGTCENLTHPTADKDHYMEGDVIRLRAGTPPTNKSYWGWDLVSYTPENNEYGQFWDIRNSITVQKAQVTTFVMPAADITIEAVYIYPGPHRLDVYGANGSGNYEYGDMPFCTAPSEDELSDDDWLVTFDHWTGPATSLIAQDTTINDIPNDIYNPTLMLYMRDYATNITANYSRQLKEPSTVNIRAYFIEERFLDRGVNDFEYFLEHAELLYDEPITKFTSVNITAPNDIRTYESTLSSESFQFAAWYRIADFHSYIEDDVVKVGIDLDGPVAYNSTSSLSVGNKSEVYIAVATKLADIYLENCKGKGLYNSSTSNEQGVLRIPELAPFECIPLPAEEDYEKIETGHHYRLSSAGIIRLDRRENVFIYNSEHKGEDDELKVEYVRVYRNRYWYRAYIFGDGKVDMSPTSWVNTFREGVSFALTGNSVDEDSNPFDAWYFGYGDRFTTAWARKQNLPLNTTYTPSGEGFLPGTGSYEHPIDIFFKTTYSNYYKPTYHHVTINYYNDTNTEILRTVEFDLRDGDSYRLNAPSPQNNVSHAFLKWVTREGAVVSDNNASFTYLHLNNADGEVDCLYYEKELKTVSIIGGTLSGYTPFETNYIGTKIERVYHIYYGQAPLAVADEAPENKLFISWIPQVEGNTDTSHLAQALAPNTTLYVSEDVYVEAVYKYPDDVIQYKLTIMNGYPSGDYTEGSNVDIRSNYPDTGYEFWKWSGADEIFTDETKYQSETRIKMPSYPVTITAKYKVEGSEPLYTLRVNYGYILEDSLGQAQAGSSEEDYPEGTVVTIKANALDPTAALNSRFYRWQGDTETLDNPTAEQTTIVIGTKDMTVNATYIGLNDYALYVVNGTGSGSYKESSRVQIIANLVDDDLHEYIFQNWSGDTEYIEHPEQDDTYVIMPENDVHVKAEYLIKNYLEIVNGTGSGFFAENTNVTINGGENFSYWTGDTDYIDNIYARQITFKMPNVPIKLLSVQMSENDANSVGYTDKMGNTVVQVSGTDDIGNLIIENATGDMAIRTEDNLGYRKTRNAVTPIKISTSADVADLSIGSIFVVGGETNG